MVGSLILGAVFAGCAAAQSASQGASSTLVSTANAQFTIPANSNNGANILPTIYDPRAIVAQDVCPGYKASNVQQNANGFTASLALAGAACNAYGTDVELLTLTVAIQDDNRLQVRIVPTYLSSRNASWFILPADLAPLPKQINGKGRIDLKFDWSNDPSFGFSITRKSTGDVLFDTRGKKIIYEDQYIEFVSALPADYNMYGLGENIHNLRLGNNYNVTLFAADSGNPIDGNIYGSHPIALETRYYEVMEQGRRFKYCSAASANASGKYVSRSHGYFNRNAHPQEILLRATSITWRALGGSIDLYFLDGPAAQDVIKQYQSGVVGLPALQQYWTFGFHQSRWGYKNWTQLEGVVNSYREFNIPLECIWTDIDYMFQYRDFTNDQNTFPYGPGQEFLGRLHANGQHYVPIVDSAIYIPNPNNASDNYSIYDLGHEQNVFMHNPDGSEYIGAVWPGYTVFPDWHAPKAVQWWADSLLGHHKNVPWDGIWIDMSEVSSFCIGSCGSQNYTKYGFAHTPFSLPGEPGNVDYRYPEGFNLTNATDAATITSLAAAQSASLAANAGPASTQPYFVASVTPGARNVVHPPYTINNVLGELSVHAMSPNATHSDGVEDYDVHNLFGHQILNATYEGLLQVFPGKRPFIIGRSTFAGSGIWAGHWGGDNISLFAYMYFSISQALNFALFGFPMFGTDTCGFTSNTDEELCNRWMQLSAFFPFYRNHNVLASISQEAYVWESVATASRTAMSIRYSLLPYMYTLFHGAHTTGSTVMRALSWEFPNEPSLATEDTQFLLGSGLMIAPVLGQGLTSRGVIFPGIGTGELWYDWYTQTAVKAQQGVNLTVAAPLGHIPVYIRGGIILPQQEALYTTAECRNSSWSLIVALDSRGIAQGDIYLDDGESVSPSATKQVALKAYKNNIRASAKGNYVDSNKLANITILGVQSAPKTVKLNGQSIGSGISYDDSSKVVSIKGLESLTSAGAWARDWQLSWS